MACESVLSLSSATKISWIDLVATYIKKVPECCLNFTDKKLEIEEFQFLIEHLPGSHVEELILAEKKLTGKMKALSDVLVKTDIKKLDVSSCDLTKQDLFDLMEVLKDTKIIELDITGNEHYASNDRGSDIDSDYSDSEAGEVQDYFSADEQSKFISLLKESHLQIFHFDIENHFQYDKDPLLEAIARTNILQFNFSEMPVAFISSLHLSSITDLTIANTLYDKLEMKILSQAMRNSTLKKLQLINSDIPDEGVDILAEGLVHSKITELNLSGNKIKGSNTLGLCLKDTQIKVLMLNENSLKHQGIFLSPNFLKLSQVVTLGLGSCQLQRDIFRKFRKCLKLSKVTELDLSSNNLQLLDISKFAKNLKKTHLERVSLSGNTLSQEAAVALAEGIHGSKVIHINLSDCFKHPEAGILLPLFLAEARGSTIDSLDFGRNCLGEAGAKTLAVHLSQTTFTQLNLSSNIIANGVLHFAKHLKFAALSVLNLHNCYVKDEGVEALAASVKESQLVELLLDHNQITSRGAESLALSLKGSKLICLDLNYNKIGRSGIKALAKGAENTFLTELSAFGNSDIDSSTIDAVVCQNKVSAYRLRSVFKRIAPQKNDSCFCFLTGASKSHVNEFLDDCLELYKNIIHEPAAVEVLLRDESVLFNKKEITSLMSSKFPEQFSQFIARDVDAKIEDHISLLKKAEDLGLNKIVELLLLNRPLYAIDRKKSILHPYVYQLLNKYNLPIYNTDIEPNGKRKIINYFKNRDIEGASDVIRLLQGKRKQ